MLTYIRSHNFMVPWYIQCDTVWLFALHVLYKKNIEIEQYALSIRWVLSPVLKVKRGLAVWIEKLMQMLYPPISFGTYFFKPNIMWWT